MNNNSNNSIDESDPLHPHNWGFVPFPDGSYQCDWAILIKSGNHQDKEWAWDDHLVMLLRSGEYFAKMEDRGGTPFLDYQLTFHSTNEVICLSRPNLKRPLAQHVLAYAEMVRMDARVNWKGKFMRHRGAILGAVAATAFFFVYGKEVLDFWTSTLLGGMAAMVAMAQLVGAAAADAWNFHVQPQIELVAELALEAVEANAANLEFQAKEQCLNPLVEWSQGVFHVLLDWIETTTGNTPAEAGMITAALLLFTMAFMYGVQSQKIKKLQQQVQNAGDSKQCVVCWDKVANRYHVPCGHSHLCEDCCHHVNNTCPVCCTPVTKFLPLYL